MKMDGVDWDDGLLPEPTGDDLPGGTPVFGPKDVGEVGHHELVAIVGVEGDSSSRSYGAFARVVGELDERCSGWPGPNIETVEDPSARGTAAHVEKVGIAASAVGHPVHARSPPRRSRGRRAGRKAAVERLRRPRRMRTQRDGPSSTALVRIAV